MSQRGLAIEPVRIALVARDRIESRGACRKFEHRRIGFRPFFPEIARACSRAAADVILFSLWSHQEHGSTCITRQEVFPRGTFHRSAVLGVLNKRQERVEFWMRATRMPTYFRQC